MDRSVVSFASSHVHCHVLLALLSIVSWLAFPGITTCSDLKVRERTSLSPSRLPVRDEPVGDPHIDYVDPEFLPERNLVAWQDLQSNEIWICGLNLDTGDFLPPDGRGQRVGLGASIVGNPFLRLLTGRGKRSCFNGPEWGNSQEGLGVYFTAVDDQQRYQAARYLLDRGDVELLTTDTTRNRIGCVPSKDAVDEQVRIGFLFGPDEVANPKQVTEAFFQFGSDESTRRVVPLDYLSFSGPRWIPGQQAGLTTLLDGRGGLQVASYDVISGVSTLLTDGPFDHVEPTIIVHPRRNQEQVLTCTEAYRRIAIYRRSGESWVRERLLEPRHSSRLSGFSRPLVSALRPFFVGERLFVVATIADFDSVLAPTQVYLLSADGGINQQISRDLPLFNVDPEAVVGSDALFIYYYSLSPIPLKPLHTRLRRCRIALSDLTSP